MSNIDVSAVDENNNEVIFSELEQADTSVLFNDDESIHIDFSYDQDDTPEEPTSLSGDESEANEQDDVPTPQSLSKRPKWSNAGAGVARLKVGHGGKTYE